MSAEESQDLILTRGENVTIFGGLSYEINDNFDFLMEYNPERYDYEVQEVLNL